MGCLDLLIMAFSRRPDPDPLPPQIDYLPRTEREQEAWNMFQEKFEAVCGDKPHTNETLRTQFVKYFRISNRPNRKNPNDYFFDRHNAEWERMEREKRRKRRLNILWPGGECVLGFAMNIYSGKSPSPL